MKTTTVELELMASEIECGDLLVARGRYVGAANMMTGDDGTAMMHVLLELGSDAAGLLRIHPWTPVLVAREVIA